VAVGNIFRACVRGFIGPAGIYCQQDLSSIKRVAVFLIFSILVGKRNWKT